MIKIKSKATKKVVPARAEYGSQRGLAEEFERLKPVSLKTIPCMVIPKKLRPLISKANASVEANYVSFENPKNPEEAVVIRFS